MNKNVKALSNRSLDYGYLGVGSVSNAGEHVDHVVVNHDVFVFSAAYSTWTSGVCTRDHYVSAIKSSLPMEVLSQFPIALASWALMSQFVPLTLSDTVIVDSVSTPMGKLLRLCTIVEMIYMCAMYR